MSKCQICMYKEAVICNKCSGVLMADTIDLLERANKVINELRRAHTVDFWENMDIWYSASQIQNEIKEICDGKTRSNEC